MVYSLAITTPISTPLSAPLRSIIKAISGVLYKIEVYFPPGSSGLVGLQLWNANVALLPVDRDEWIHGDNVTISFDDIQELSISENVLDVFTYNNDTKWQHIIEIRIGIATRKQWEERYAPGVAIAKMNESITAFSTAVMPEPFQADDAILEDVQEDEDDGEIPVL